MQTNLSQSFYDAIVIGGGHAGLSMSYYLNQNNIDHLVLERGRIGESWRSQRWDSFKLNTPNWINVLPGDSYKRTDRDGFASSNDFADSLSAYTLKFYLPVVENSEVISLNKSPDTQRFRILVSENGNVKHYSSRKVVIASGCMNEKLAPKFAKNISPGILQLHASEYKNPFQLPPGNVLIAGSGQSGCEIAEDLLDSCRNVFFSTSMVPRTPRRYRGRDIMEWLILTKFMDVRKDEITDPQMLNMRQPQFSGTGRLGHTISLQSLSGRGARILGKLYDADKTTVHLHPDAIMHVRFADGFSKKIKDMIDGYIKQTGLDAPEAEPDIADEPDISADCAWDITKLNLEDNNIKTIIWTTGFGANFNWIKLPVIDKEGKPKYKSGISEVDGLYFLGFPWLRKRKSGIIFGINEDSEFISELVCDHRPN